MKLRIIIIRGSKCVAMKGGVLDFIYYILYVIGIIVFVTKWSCMDYPTVLY